MICLIATIFVFNVSIILALALIKQFMTPPSPSKMKKKRTTEHNGLNVLISYFSSFFEIGFFTKASE